MKNSVYTNVSNLNNMYNEIYHNVINYTQYEFEYGTMFVLGDMFDLFFRGGTRVSKTASSTHVSTKVLKAK